MHLIDIGANLTHDSFDRDRDAVLERARQAGVVQMVITGASREHSPLALQLAQQHPGFLYATAGVHPHHAVEYTEECDAEMRALHARPEVVAVGECGLDYFRDFSPRPAQHRAFERQLQLAADNGKPLFLHQRDAHADFMAQMKNFEGRIGPAVVHCFTGERDELFDYLDQDWYIGITGWLCDERRGAHLRELVKNIPANRLMIETDAPYLLPRTLKPMPKDRRNEPMFLSHIVEELARDRGEDVAVTAANATAATRTFFRLPGTTGAGRAGPHGSWGTAAPTPVLHACRDCRCACCSRRSAAVSGSVQGRPRPRQEASQSRPTARRRPVPPAAVPARHRPVDTAHPRTAAASMR